MNFLKESIKQSAMAPLIRPLYRGGYIFPRRLLKMISPQTIIILYHRVVDLPNDTQSMNVSPQNFESHLAHLTQYYSILSLDQFLENLKNKKPLRRGILITFDDGYEDNYRYAFPLLKKYEVPATIFVAGTGAQTHEFWWDELERLKLPEKERLTIYEKLKNLTPPKRTETLENFFSARGLKRNTRKDYQTCTATQLKEMINSRLVTIGGHTVNHPKLSILESDEQRQEIAENFNYIRNKLEYTPQAFAYPYGSPADFNEISVAIVSQHYQAAFTTVKTAVNKKTNFYQIPRFTVKNWREQKFSARIRNFFMK